MSNRLFKVKDHIELEQLYILDHEQIYFERGVMQTIYIRVDKPPINKDGDRYKLPSVFDPTFRSRIRKVMVRQEVQRKRGIAIQIEEEQLRTNLETAQAELNAPAQMKGRLNEMMSQVRLQSHVGGGRGAEQYQISPELQQEIRQHLKQQQEGLSHLINTIKEDIEDLKLIDTGLEEASLVR